MLVAVAAAVNARSAGGAAEMTPLHGLPAQHPPHRVLLDGLPAEAGGDVVLKATPPAEADQGGVLQGLERLGDQKAEAQALLGAHSPSRNPRADGASDIRQANPLCV